MIGGDLEFRLWVERVGNQRGYQQAGILDRGRILGLLCGWKKKSPE